MEFGLYPKQPDVAKSLRGGLRHRQVPKRGEGHRCSAKSALAEAAIREGDDADAGKGIPDAYRDDVVEIRLHPAHRCTQQGSGGPHPRMFRTRVTLNPRGGLRRRQNPLEGAKDPGAQPKTCLPKLPYERAKVRATMQTPAKAFPMHTGIMLLKRACTQLTGAPRTMPIGRMNRFATCAHHGGIHEE